MDPDAYTDMDYQRVMQHIASSTPEARALSFTLNLNSEIDEPKADCLNQLDNHTIQHLLTNSRSIASAPLASDLYLESSSDEQLLLSIPFKNKVNIRTIAFWAPDSEECPSTIKLYVNKSMDFDDTDDAKPTETIHLKREDAVIGKEHTLKFINFRNVVSLCVFVADNHGAETSILQRIKLIGSITTDRSKEKLTEVNHMQREI